MSEHSFAIIASGLDPSSPDFENRFFEAGCDDATMAFQKGVMVLAFDREAKNLIHAVQSAIEDVKRAGAKIERIEPDYLVSLSDIAERTSLTRAAVSLWSQGKRGEGFPLPIARFTTATPLWDWVEVSRWLVSNQQLPKKSAVDARIVRRINKQISDEEKHQDKISA